MVITFFNIRSEYIIVIKTPINDKKTISLDIQDNSNILTLLTFVGLKKNKYILIEFLTNAILLITTQNKNIIHQMIFRVILQYYKILSIHFSLDLT